MWVIPNQAPQLKCQEPDCVQEIYSLSSYQYHVEAIYKTLLYLFCMGIMYKYDLVYKIIGVILSVLTNPACHNHKMLVCSLRLGVFYCSPQLLRSRADKEPSALAWGFYCLIHWYVLSCIYTCEISYSLYVKKSRPNFLSLVFSLLAGQRNPEFWISIFSYLPHHFSCLLFSFKPFLSLWAYFISMRVINGLFRPAPVAVRAPKGWVALFLPTSLS